MEVMNLTSFIVLIMTLGGGIFQPAIGQQKNNYNTAYDSGSLQHYKRPMLVTPEPLPQPEYYGSSESAEKSLRSSNVDAGLNLAPSSMMQFHNDQGIR